MAWPIIAAAGLSALGSIAASRVGAGSAKQQMRFQERMSNTAVQRQMADLRRAGLNPMLSAKLGGSSSPQGAKFMPENPLKDLPASALALKQFKNIEAQTLVQEATARKLDEETNWIRTQRNQAEGKYGLVIEDYLESIRGRRASTALARANKDKAIKSTEQINETIKRYRVIGRWADDLTQIHDDFETVVEMLLKKVKAEAKKDNSVMNQVPAFLIIKQLQNWLTKNKKAK